MDFFNQQDSARKRTGLLVFLFTLAVLAITALVSVISIGIYFSVSGEPFDTQQIIEYCLFCFAGVVLVVLLS